MRVLFCGSRAWDKPFVIEALVMGMWCRTGGELVVIHGAAPGADSIAGDYAERHGIPTEAYPADWGTHGKAAGPIRNQRMLDDGRPQVVFAFTDDLASSRGTADMVRRARRAGIPVYVTGRAT